MFVRNNRRSWRNFLAYPNFQFRLALVQVVFVGLVAAVLFLTLILPEYGKPITPDNTLMQYAVAQMVLQVFDRVGVAMIAIMVVSALYHIFFSHRLCGPLINMGHTFDRLAQGDTTRKVFLRRKDFLKKEAQRINAMLDAVEIRITELKKNHEAMAGVARQLPVGHLEDRLRGLMEENQRLLDQWRVAFESQPAAGSVSREMRGTITSSSSDPSERPAP